ncbi:MAG: sulfurtransferase TusA family protein [Dactylosporangium sp.]|nr:sulfurtransferase TusA family protein [Dactylosporangium sp.]NNJ59835.1 sulfurtransferase TusA family protein [Dactylosporangium sp.]
MAKIQLDYRGLKCPLPTLKINQFALSNQAKPGDIVEIVADCPTFEADIKKWCSTTKKMLIKCYNDGKNKTAQIQF